MMHSFTVIVVLVVFYPLATFATTGVDVSTAVSETNWKCILDDGYTFAIVRIYQSSGRVDPNGAQTIKNARAAGIKYVDGYIFPCYSCGNAAQQVKDAINALTSAGATIGQVWLDIEGGTQYWSSNYADNINFIQELVNECNALKVTVAMYTSASQWGPITGGSTQFKSLQLWYAHYDDVESFSDFAAFGGWTKPTMKQYIGDQTFCSTGVDKNWYP